MITVVKEKDDFSTDLLLQAASRRNLSEQESLGKKSARLLAETNNRMIHYSERVSYARGRFPAAKECLLQDRRENQHGRAPDKIIPEVTDTRRREEDEHKRLCDERGKKYRGAGNSTNEERC